MSRQLSSIVAFLLAVLCAVSIAQDGRILIGAGKRLVDIDLREKVLRIIGYRVETGVVVEPLLIFSPFADPDVLGSIAIDDAIALQVREIAANALLDQLYVADSYFQAAADHYIEIFMRSSERSLRLKGWIGGAIIEYRLYGLTSKAEDRHLVQLQYAAARETDPRVRQYLDELNEGDSSLLIGSAAWVSELAADKPYRRFDVSNPDQPDGENGKNKGEAWLVEAWDHYQRIRTLLDAFVPDSVAPGATVNATSVSLSFNGTHSIETITSLSNADLAGFLSRFSATAPARPGTITLSDEFVHLFRQLARKQPDPYIRALALAPLRFAAREIAVEEFITGLNSDRSPLVRLSLAEALAIYSEDRSVRDRMIAAFRVEEDARVRLHILHALVQADPATLAPDVQAFLLSRLREEENVEVLGYAVHSLGTARLRSVVGIFSRMLTTSSDPVLRARIAEALTRLGQGTRLRSLEDPRQ